MQEIDHDLFKLEVATMKKNTSFTDNPIYEHFEHCHIFHTVDSSGKVQTTSTAVGGHFHPIEVVEGPGGVPQLQVLPPHRWAKQYTRGRMRRVAVPLSDDDHTHSVKYMGSEKIQLRQVNPEFVKMESAITAKQNPKLEGIESL